MKHIDASLPICPLLFSVPQNFPAAGPQHVTMRAVITMSTRISILGWQVRHLLVDTSSQMTVHTTLSQPMITLSASITICH